MAELKTKPTKVSPASFIANIADPATRRDCRTIMAMMRKATGAKPTMWGPSIVGFGFRHYVYASGREGERIGNSSCLLGSGKVYSVNLGSKDWGLAVPMPGLTGWGTRGRLFRFAFSTACFAESVALYISSTSRSAAVTGVSARSL